MNTLTIFMGFSDVNQIHWPTTTFAFLSNVDFIFSIFCAMNINFPLPWVALKNDASRVVFLVLYNWSENERFWDVRSPLPLFEILGTESSLLVLGAIGRYADWYGRRAEAHLNQSWGSQKASWSSNKSWRWKSWIDETGRLGGQLHGPCG